MGVAAICIVTMHVLCHRHITNCGHNIPTKFGDNRVNGEYIKHLSESQDSSDHHVELSVLRFDVIVVF